MSLKVCTVHSILNTLRLGCTSPDDYHKDSNSTLEESPHSLYLSTTFVCILLDNALPCQMMLHCVRTKVEPCAKCFAGLLCIFFCWNPLCQYKSLTQTRNQ